MRRGFHHGGRALSEEVLKILRQNHDQFVSQEEILESAFVQITSVISPFLRRKPPDLKGAKGAVHSAVCYLRRTRGTIITCERRDGITRYCWVE